MVSSCIGEHSDTGGSIWLNLPFESETEARTTDKFAVLTWLSLYP